MNPKFARALAINIGAIAQDTAIVQLYNQLGSRFIAREEAELAVGRRDAATARIADILQQPGTLESVVAAVKGQMQKPEMTQKEQEQEIVGVMCKRARGELLVRYFNLRPTPGGAGEEPRYNTMAGTKSLIGLYEVAKRIVSGEGMP